MQQRGRGRGLPPTKLKRAGHRSHVAGTRRLLSGKKKDAIADALHRDAAAMMRRLRQPKHSHRSK